MYKLVQFGKFKINCYRVRVATVCSLSQNDSRHFQIPTQSPHIGHPEQGNTTCATCSPVWHDASVHRRPQGLAQTSSLSSAYIGNDRWKISPPPSPFLPPCWGEPRFPHRRLVTVLPSCSMIPLVELLLTTLCSFCPRFRDDQARALATTVHPAVDHHWRQWALAPVLPIVDLIRTPSPTWLEFSHSTFSHRHPNRLAYVDLSPAYLS
jgi:hypothetical protein